MKISNWWLQDDVFSKQLNKQASKLDKRIRELNAQYATKSSGGWVAPQYIIYDEAPAMAGEWHGKIFSKLFDHKGVAHSVKGQWTSWDDYMAQLAPVDSAMFEDAVEHIRVHGWTRGNDVDHDTGEVCAQGAFGLWTVQKIDGFTVNNYDSVRAEVFRSRMDEIMDLMGIEPKWGSVIHWNDAEDRTKDQVVDALTKAAKKLRDEGR